MSARTLMAEVTEQRAESGACSSYPESRRNSTKSTAFEVDEINVSRLEAKPQLSTFILSLRPASLKYFRLGIKIKHILFCIPLDLHYLCTIKQREGQDGD